MEGMLTSNAYPEETVKRACQRMSLAQALGPRSHQRSLPEGVLTLTYISEPILHQVRRAVRRSGLNLWIAQLSAQSSPSLPRKNPLPRMENCPACLTGGRCATKNVVYRLKCVLCLERYIGETKRPIWERIMEHRSRDAKHPWGAHFATAHRDSPTPNVPFRAKIVSRAKNHVHRNTIKAIKIAEDNPTANMDRGWQLLPTIRGCFI